MVEIVATILLPVDRLTAHRLKRRCSYKFMFESCEVHLCVCQTVSKKLTTLFYIVWHWVLEDTKERGLLVSCKPFHVFHTNLSHNKENYIKKHRCLIIGVVLQYCTYLVKCEIISNHILIGPVLPYYTPTCQLNAHAHGPAHITLVAKLIIC